MKGLFPGDDNSLGDANKDKYYRYIGVVSEIRAGKSKSFLIADKRLSIKVVLEKLVSWPIRPLAFCLSCPY